jgi:tRNA modification GTPase
MDLLRQHLKTCMGFQNVSEGSFSARRRHLQALEKSATFLRAGQQQLLEAGAGELLAEDLRQSQLCLGEITGAISSDELLGHIFSSFCIGK